MMSRTVSTISANVSRVRSSGEGPSHFGPREPAMFTTNVLPETPARPRDSPASMIPAARPDVIRKDNVHRLKTKLVPQGANIPFTPEAERILHEKGVLVLPDFIANAGGVICASVEYHGGAQAQALQTIEEKIRANTSTVLEESTRSKTLPREAAIALAERRVRNAMQYRC